MKKYRKLRAMADKLMLHRNVARTRMQIINEGEYRTHTPRELGVGIRAALDRALQAIEEGKPRLAKAHFGVALGLAWWLHTSSPLLTHYKTRMGWFWKEAKPVIRRLCSLGTETRKGKR